MIYVSDSNVAWILRASCKLESIGMIRLCAEHLLFNCEEIKTFEKISLLDRCYLHELIEPALWDVMDLDTVLSLTKHPSYASLSTKAKASMMDWSAQLLRQTPKTTTNAMGHSCKRCKIDIKCHELRQWICPHCSYQVGFSRSNERK